jgi:hypothetical protein
MRRCVIISSTLLVLGVVLIGIDVVGAQDRKQFRTDLTGYEELPLTISTAASGQFHARINNSDTAIDYELSYSDLEGTVTQAHIHFGSRAVAGGISVWLCSNLASPPTPPGTQPCPAPPATITGTITAANVVGPAGQGIDPGEFDELISAMRSGNTYANVHSTKFQTGEVRGQLAPGKSDH